MIRAIRDLGMPSSLRSSQYKVLHTYYGPWVLQVHSAVVTSFLLESHIFSAHLKRYLESMICIINIPIRPPINNPRSQAC